MINPTKYVQVLKFRKNYQSQLQNNFPRWLDKHKYLLT